MAPTAVLWRQLHPWLWHQYPKDSFSTVAVVDGIDEDYNDNNDVWFVAICDDAVVIVLLKWTTTIPAPTADAVGGDNDHHNFCCSSDFSSSAALDATTVNMLTIFEWERAGEGGGKKDGYCINKDGDGVQ
jgi:hypothetical protein